MDSEILKLLKRILLFLFFFPLSYFIFIIIWGQAISPDDSGHLQSRLKDLEKTKDIDILFIGSSRSYRHYDTRIFRSEGYDVFVLGSSAQTLIQSEFLLRKYIDQLNPELVVLDVYPLMFTTDGRESTLDIISNSNRNYDLGTFDLVMKHKNLKVFNYMLYFYIKELLQDPNLEKEKSIENGDKYIKGGYVQKELKFAEHKETRPRYIDLNETQVKSFQGITHIVRNSGTKVIFVQSPMQKTEFKSYKNFHYIDSLMDINNLPLHVFNEKLNLNDSLHFYDPAHLNQAGVELYNNFFIQHLLYEEK